MEVTDHVSARNIENEVSFDSKIPCVLKKIEVIMSQITSRIKRTSHKCEIEVPTSLKYAAEIDSRNKIFFGEMP